MIAHNKYIRIMNETKEAVSAQGGSPDAFETGPMGEHEID